MLAVLGAKIFKLGDPFRILITGAPHQPVSVRTMVHGRTDWGPIVGSTDSTGKWSTEGQFTDSDFGDWRELWTVGRELTSPAIQFSVNAPCLPGISTFAHISGMNVSITCDTQQGRRTFATSSDSDSFRTPDGRVVPGRMAQRTPEQYATDVLEDFIVSSEPRPRIALQSSKGGLGEEAADLIAKRIGSNALTDDEMRNVLIIVRSAFGRPETIAPSAKQPFKTVTLLRHLTGSHDTLKRDIAETVTYVQSR